MGQSTEYLLMKYYSVTCAGAARDLHSILKNLSAVRDLHAKRSQGLCRGALQSAPTDNYD